jgi:hypothetical protein
MYGRAFYEDVADALMGFLPPSLRDFGYYRTNSNLKVWYGDEGREHYEVQILKHNKKIVLEIGFHAEHKDKARNEDAMQRLARVEKRWRGKLGSSPEVGPFIGHQSGTWRRVSEMWDATDDPELAVDAAARLADYITVLEPIRKPASETARARKTAGARKTARKTARKPVRKNA